MTGVKLTAVLLLLSLMVPVRPQEEGKCSYMLEIPRPETPNLPESDFEGEWNDRPLLPPPARDEVCMGEYLPAGTATGQQLIYMEEEIEGHVIIAKLNIDPSANPEIEVPLLQGQFYNLLPELRQIPELGNNWFLVITQRQDYEIQAMRSYFFTIRVPGQTRSIIVVLQIVNIDDNPPVIQALEPCEVPELGEARLTECVYKVSDVDGEISTRFMNFTVLSDRNDDEIFYMEGENIQGDWVNMRMIVGIKEPLNFDTNRLYMFNVLAEDSRLNNDTVPLFVRVQVVPHRAPRWVEIFAVQQFDEMQARNFTVQALDPDEDITATINYEIITDPEDTFFSLEVHEGGSGATLMVEPIDRDLLERDLFRLSIVAYKSNNESLRDEANVVIIVNDINNKRPEPLHKEYFADIDEETPLTLDFGEEFGFHDRDLGENAQYTVELRDVYPPGAASAFIVAPNEGYQRQLFIMSTRNHSMLDYEVEEFQNIVLELVATDKNNSEHIGIATLYINLLNWNDEVPIFEETNYEATFKETVEKDFPVATVFAEDRDINDAVIHTLMGNAAEFLRINESSGEIFVAVDNAFDYHRQNVYFVQVRADDTLDVDGRPTHTTTTQLVIHLEDVNNTPPTLRLPRASPSVQENVPAGHVIETGIRATDPDTTAHLEFDINWDESWATKQGRPTPAVEYRECVRILTSYENEEHKGSATGTILAREVRDNVTIDFEEFEVLYLSIRVHDLNTVDGDDYDEAIFTVNIIDMNDNRPLFAVGSLEQTFRVREMSAAGTVIGSLLATDIDGPDYNNVHYQIYPVDGTPEGLVRIHPTSGQMTVDADEEIDADVPPRYHLYYTVVASDRCIVDECPDDATFWDTPGQIQIEILDTNNKFPVEDSHLFESVVPVYEDEKTGYQIVQVFASDLDRDELYHEVRYQINYEFNPRLRLFFEIDQETGWLYINYTGNEVLDRDRGEPRHTIPINLIDNFFTAGEGRRNQNTTTVEVVLLDVNDNAPELPDDLFWDDVSENLLEGELVNPIIFAPDADEPGTDNSRVGYSVRDMNSTREIHVPILFDTHLIEHEDGNRARLRTNRHLRGYWGSHMIHIRAFDHGDPPLDSDMWYPVYIRPFNYHDPEFVFPLPGSTIRLARERAAANSLLVLADGISTLPRITATDPDGLEAGQVSFSIVGNAEALQYFDVTDDRENGATLILQRVPEDIIDFQLTIRATDGGTDPGSRSTDVTVRVVFVTTLGEPIFGQDQVTVPFTEGPTGLEQSHELPRAEDPKNYGCTDDCNDIFYRIVGGNTGGFFQLDPVENKVSLLRELSQEESRNHTIIVAASNSPTATGVPLDGSSLTVVINVIEEHPRPIFEREIYTAGISVLDPIQKELLTVRATHSLGYAITYAIDQDSMVADSSLADVAGRAFLLHATSGVLTLNMQPTASMHGMFQFHATAADTDGGVGTAVVRIYLISSLNRVVITFDNTLDVVDDNSEFIADTFSAAFHMTCNIDQVLPASDDSGAARDDVTEVRAHFIRDNVPVLAVQIEPLLSDTFLLMQIQESLNERELKLQDLSTGAGSSEDDSQQTAIYVLAALAALLAFLCLVLLFTFIFRTRALNRRLQALSMTKYGSVDSGLNRMGLAPGTNKHTAEGSNPIYNENIRAPDFDAISDISNDSDLIGIEELPQFRGDYYPPADAGSTDGIMPRQSESVASHNNNFFFNANPFNPEFANRQLRK